MMATALRVPVDQIKRLEAALRRHETLKPDYADAYENRGLVKRMIRDIKGGEADAARAKQLRR
jgi:hypothetical protein